MTEPMDREQGIDRQRGSESDKRGDWLRSFGVTTSHERPDSIGQGIIEGKQSALEDGKVERRKTHDGASES